jgi:hypothetical protein
MLPEGMFSSLEKAAQKWANDILTTCALRRVSETFLFSISMCAQKFYDQVLNFV